MKNIKFPYKISPMQLVIYLQFASKYATEHDFYMEKLDDLIKGLLSVQWDKDALLYIDELPF